MENTQPAATYAKGHVLAAPPPPFVHPPPRRVKRAVVCGHPSEWPHLIESLKARLGPRSVRSTSPNFDDLQALQADAVFIPNALPPFGCRSMRSLRRLSGRRLVVISLSAFAKITGRAVTLVRSTRRRGPFHGCVQAGSFLTRGFALLDIFPLSFQGKTGFVQRYLRADSAARKFFDRHGLAVILTRLHDPEVEGRHPICLYAEYGSGALLVMDLEPFESKEEASCGGRWLGSLLSNALGAEKVSLGQFVSAPPGRRRMADELIELADRFPAMTLSQTDESDASHRKQSLQIVARNGGSAGSGESRPCLVIRTGHRFGDYAAHYGALLWMKQLARPAPHSCPYLDSLTRLFDVAWLPFQHDQKREWVRGDALLKGAPAAIIDVTMQDSNARLGVIARQATPFVERLHRWLPGLQAAIVDDRSVTQKHEAAPWLRIEPASFPFPIQDQARNEGAEWIRIELPAANEDFTVGSIGTTNHAAAIIESVVGLLFGLIAVNRTAASMEIPLPQAKILRTSDIKPVAAAPDLARERYRRVNAGTFVLPPATYLCVPHSRFE